ncbi:tRNA (adenosine(37)-N6)-dimethylallyltransferase MiaA [Rurimicrobium arvi]|uniref:tRNA dimethylallyltransferase n=1 Tax=Rurimicrobium arvi TaxID=2049916 RepID=A0ABP8MKQ3_9BACT
MPKPLLIVIAGPTGVGKTRLAIELASHFHTEVISADSRQCYQGMVIGTAQPDAGERAAVPHHFIDCANPAEPLTAADFERFATDLLSKLFANHKVVVLCGGTGLYIKAVCDGLDEMPEVPDHFVQAVDMLYKTEGIAGLQQAIRTEDPEYHSEEMNNPARLMRALSFIRATGESITRFRTGVKKERPFNILKIGLEMPRAILYQRINLRVDQMMDAGLEAEVRALVPLRGLKNLNTVGYAELFDYFDGKLSLSEAIEKIRQHSRNYAKRQLTWFKKDSRFLWKDARSPYTLNEIIHLAEKQMAE